MTQKTMMTDDELLAVRQAGELWTTLCRVVGDGPTQIADLAELVVHVHAIQHAVMAQAAARAYPTTFRLLGKHPPLDGTPRGAWRPNATGNP